MKKEHSAYLKLSVKNRPPYRLRADFKDGFFSGLYVPYPVTNLEFTSMEGDDETFSATDLEQRVMFFLEEGRTGPKEMLWNDSDSITLLEDTSELDEVEPDEIEPMYVVFKSGRFNSVSDALHYGAILTKSEGLASMLSKKCKMQMSSVFLPQKLQDENRHLTIEEGEEIVGIHLLALHDLHLTYQFCATSQEEMMGMIPHLKQWLEPLLPVNLVNICAGISTQVDGIDDIRYWSRRYTECDPYREKLTKQILLSDALQQRKLVHVEDLDAEFPLVPAGAKVQGVDSEKFLPKEFPKGKCLISEFNGEISVVALKVPHGASQFYIYSGEALTNISAWHVASNTHKPPEEPTAPKYNETPTDKRTNRGLGR